MGVITESMTVDRALEIFVKAPLNDSNLALSLLPIVAGAMVMELYFGRYTEEELGWNTAVGNSIIWLTTGVTLFTVFASTPGEKNAALGLIALGLFFGIMDFTHKWPDYIAFFVSSSGIVYSITYAVTILVRTDLEVDAVSLRAAALFIVGSNIVFKIIELVEPSKNNGSGLDI